MEADSVRPDGFLQGSVNSSELVSARTRWDSDWRSLLCGCQQLPHESDRAHVSLWEPLQSDLAESPRHKAPITAAKKSAYTGDVTVCHWRRSTGVALFGFGRGDIPKLASLGDPPRFTTQQFNYGTLFCSKSTAAETG